jgi:hypothetical protein
MTTAIFSLIFVFYFYEIEISVMFIIDNDLNIMLWIAAGIVMIANIILVFGMKYQNR